MNTNLFYFKTLNSIGGIETFFYNLARKYGKDYDITIMYQEADPAQVKRLSQYVRVRKYRNGERVRCKRCFVAFNAALLDNIEADEYIQMLHGDYRGLGVVPDSHPKIQRWVSCSEAVRSAYADITGKDSVVCYNPFVKDKTKKVLRLVSATRLTPEKGLRRMEQLADTLDAKGVLYTWDVFTDSPRVVKNANIVLRQPRLDVLSFIADADYYVQLSDCEGYCYSVVEALSVGTPVIVTAMSVVPEIGVINGENGWILPMDMSDIPVSKIVKGLKQNKIKYTPLEDRWGELLIKAPPTYEEDMKRIVKVKCTHVFYDLDRTRMAEPGEEWEVPLKRAEILYDLGVVDIEE